jgi:hypothetical protein
MSLGAVGPGSASASSSMVASFSRVVIVRLPALAAAVAGWRRLLLDRSPHP